MSQRDLTKALMLVLQDRGFVVQGETNLRLHKMSRAPETRVTMVYPNSTLACTIGGVSTFMFHNRAGRITTVFQHATRNLEVIVQLLPGILDNLSQPVK